MLLKLLLTYLLTYLLGSVFLDPTCRMVDQTRLMIRARFVVKPEGWSALYLRLNQRRSIKSWGLKKPEGELNPAPDKLGTAYETKPNLLKDITIEKVGESKIAPKF